MRKKHAIHNESLCDMLLSDGKFNDWVVTTAFYSALHYVHNEAFPLTDGTTTYNEFDSYFIKVVKVKSKRISKHEAIKHIVRDKISKANPHYRWLHDACMNSRYKNYAVTDAKATMARQRLNQIKAHLTK